MTSAKTLLCCFVAIGIVLRAPGARAEQEVVLVAAADSPLETLNSLELRKVYLGVPVTRKGTAVVGLRNTSDEQLERIFLQTVVAMSEKSYARRMLSLTLRFGIPRTPEYQDAQTLREALLANPYSISYMWRHDAAPESGLKILKVLWRTS
jgi:hypothetical protein